MTKLHYFAYGSNLHPLRLQARVPSAKVIGVVKVECKKLEFSKKSKDQSGKCNLHETSSQWDIVFGVLYNIEEREKKDLERAEGKGSGYNEESISFELNGKPYTAFTYIADSDHIDVSLLPYEWYKQFVVEGAKFHSMPQEYIAQLDSISAIPDPNAKRNDDNQAKLKEIKEFNNRKVPTSS